MGERSDFSAEQRKAKRRRRFRQTIIGLLVAAAATTLYAWRLDIASHGVGDALTDLFSYVFDRTGYPVPLESEPTLLLSVGSRPTVLTAHSLRSYNRAGKLVLSDRLIEENTLAVAAGKYLLTYARGGYELEVRTGDIVLFHETTERPIYAATISESGAVAVATGATGDRSQVTVYDTKFQEQFVWASANRMIHALSLDASGKQLAVGGISFPNGVLESVTHVFSLVTGAELAQLPLTDEMLVSVSMQSDGAVLMVTDRGAHAMTAKGEKFYTYSFSDAPLSAMCWGKNGELWLALGDFTANHRLHLVRLDDRVKLLAETDYDKEILALHPAGSGVVGFLGERVIPFDARFSPGKTVETPAALAMTVVDQTLYYATAEALCRTDLR